MRLLDLHYFMCVAEEGNLTRASRKLFISQQALSERIARIEQYYNVSLFVRAPRAMILTPQGQALYQAARQICQIDDDVKKQFSHEAADCKIRLGMNPGYVSHYVGQLLPLVRERYPAIDVQIHTGITSELEKKLLDGSISIAVSPNNYRSPEIMTQPIRRVRLCAALSDAFMRENHIRPQTLSRWSCGVKTSELARYPFLATIEGNQLRRVFDQLYARQGLTPQIVVESDEANTLFRLCSQGVGIFFASESLISAQSEWFASSKEDRLHALPIDDEQAYLDLVIASRSDHAFSKPEMRLKACIAEVFSSVSFHSCT